MSACHHTTLLTHYTRTCFRAHLSALQVLQQLAAICCHVSRDAPRSLAAFAALDLLSVFLKKTALLREDLGPGTLTDMLTPNIINSNTSRAVLRTICTQLLQSGLLDSMTGVLTAAAEDLQSQQPQQGHNYVR